MIKIVNKLFRYELKVLLAQNDMKGLSNLSEFRSSQLY